MFTEGRAVFFFVVEPSLNSSDWSYEDWTAAPAWLACYSWPPLCSRGSFCPLLSNRAAQRRQQEQCFRLHPACQMCARRVQTHRNTQSGDDRTGNIGVLTAAMGGNKKALFRLNAHLLKHLIIILTVHAGYNETRLAICIFSLFPE